MLKNSIAALLACLYIGLSVWLVRGEGQSYREGLKRGRTPRSVTEPSDLGTARQAGNSSNVAAAPARVTEPEPRNVEPHESVAAAPDTAPASPTPAAEHARSKQAGHGKAKAKNAPTDPPQVAVHKPASPKPDSSKTADTRHEKLDTFWSMPEAQKKWDLAKLDDQNEMRLGQDLHAMIVQFNPPTSNGALQERVYKAAKPIQARITRKDIHYNFTILDSDDINAFSHPGGYVYLSRGMFPFIGEEDAVLQFVLAHEIAHVDHQDMIHCLQDPGVQSIDMSTLQKVYFIILPLGYLDQQEFAADQWAYRQLIALDHTRYEALKFLRKLKGYATEHEFGEGRVNYKLRPGSSPVQNHLWANTAAWRRLDELESFVNSASPKPQ